MSLQDRETTSGRERKMIKVNTLKDSRVQNHILREYEDEFESVIDEVHAPEESKRSYLDY